MYICTHRTSSSFQLKNVNLHRSNILWSHFLARRNLRILFNVVSIYEAYVCQFCKHLNPIGRCWTYYYSIQVLKEKSSARCHLCSPTKPRCDQQPPSPGQNPQIWESLETFGVSSDRTRCIFQNFLSVPWVSYFTWLWK